MPDEKIDELPENVSAEPTTSGPVGRRPSKNELERQVAWYQANVKALEDEVLRLREELQNTRAQAAGEQVHLGELLEAANIEIDALKNRPTAGPGEVASDVDHVFVDGRRHLISYRGSVRELSELCRKRYVLDFHTALVIEKDAG